jgi:hypothetical protein
MSILHTLWPWRFTVLTLFPLIRRFWLNSDGLMTRKCDPGKPYSEKLWFETLTQPQWLSTDDMIWLAWSNVTFFAKSMRVCLCRDRSIWHNTKTSSLWRCTVLTLSPLIRLSWLNCDSSMTCKWDWKNPSEEEIMIWDIIMIWLLIGGLSQNIKTC